MQDKKIKDPIEAEDFSVNENEQPENFMEETGDENQAEEDENDLENDENSEIEKLTAELGEQKDKYIRLMAEFDNFRRRTSKENIELRQTAGKEVIVSMLDVLDDIDRAENQMENSDHAEGTLNDGVLLIFNKIRSTLEAKGLKAIPLLHTEFDVERAEAISEMPVDDKKLKGKIIAEVQKGYTLNDKIIRFGKVIVGK